MNEPRRIGAGVEDISLKRCHVLLSQLINPDGSYNFKSIEDALAEGPIVLKIMCNDPSARQHFHGESMPVLGVPSTMAHLVRPYQHEGIGLCYEYEYNDTLFGLVLNNFIAELGTRFDGHPNLLAVEAGLFGAYGEGSTWAKGKTPMIGKKIQRRVFSQYLHFFPTTPVLVRLYRQLPHDKTQISVGYEFANREKPLGLHCDSFGTEGGYEELNQLNEFQGILKRTIAGAELYPPMTVELLTTRFGELKQKVKEHGLSYVKLNRRLIEGNKEALDNLYELDRIIKGAEGMK